MALLWVEGFDHYGCGGDMLQGNWASEDTFVNQWYIPHLVTPGRYGGKCVGTLGAVNTYTAFLSRSVGGLMSGGFVGFAITTNTNTGGGGGGQIGVQFLRSGSAQFGVQLTSNGSVQVVTQLNTNGPGSVVLASSGPNVFTFNVWQFIEVGFTIGNPGTVTVRVGGVVVLTATGISTTNGVPTSPFADTISFNVGGGASPVASIDDIYLCDNTTGGGPNPFNTFQGDCRVQTMFPAGAGALTQWTPMAPSLTPPAGTSTGAFTQNNNQIIFPMPPGLASTNGIPALGVVMPQNPAWAVPLQNSVTLTSLTVYANGAATCSLIPVVYLWDTATNAPGALVATGSANNAIVSGANTLVFPTPPVLAAGTNYVFGFMIGGAPFNFNVSNTYTTVNEACAAYPCVYPNAPGDLTGATQSIIYGGGAPLLTWTGNIVNYGNVQENNNDGDFTYNSSATPGAIDLYTIGNPLPPNANVLAVQLTGCYRKDDANARTLSQVVYSTGVTHPVAPAHQVNASYTYTIDVLPLNPTTATQWTAAVVNAMQIGVELVS